MILLLVTIMYNPVNKVDRATTKYILLIRVSLIALDNNKSGDNNESNNDKRNKIGQEGLCITGYPVPLHHIIHETEEWQSP